MRLTLKLMHLIVVPARSATESWMKIPWWTAPGRRIFGGGAGRHIARGRIEGVGGAQQASAMLRRS